MSAQCENELLHQHLEHAMYLSWGFILAGVLFCAFGVFLLVWRRDRVSEKAAFDIRGFKFTTRGTLGSALSLALPTLCMFFAHSRSPTTAERSGNGGSHVAARAGETPRPSTEAQAALEIPSRAANSYLSAASVFPEKLRRAPWPQLASKDEIDAATGAVSLRADQEQTPAERATMAALLKALSESESELRLDEVSFQEMTARSNKQTNSASTVVLSGDHGKAFANFTVKPAGDGFQVDLMSIAEESAQDVQKRDTQSSPSD